MPYQACRFRRLRVREVGRNIPERVSRGRWSRLQSLRMRLTVKVMEERKNARVQEQQKDR